jgi:hypothetical protein
MDKQIAQVLNGFLSLTDSQKQLFQKYLVEATTGTPYSRQLLREGVNASITKMQTGPHGGGCACCGR